MKKSKLIFYLIFGAFHLFLVIFSMYADSQKNDFAFLTGMLSYLPLMKWGAVLGLILLIVDFVWAFISNRESEKERAAITHELNTLKAKLFDLQEAEKKIQQTPKPNA